MSEPLNIFMALVSLADRAQANSILEYPVIALNTSLQKNETLLNEMRRRRGSAFRPNSGETVSGEKLKAALALAHRINEDKTMVSTDRAYTPQEIINNRENEKVEK